MIPPKGFDSPLRPKPGVDDGRLGGCNPPASGTLGSIPRSGTIPSTAEPYERLRISQSQFNSEWGVQLGR